MYIADASNYRVRKVTVSTSIITTVGGLGDTGGYCGDNTTATTTTLYFPTGISLDASG